MGDMFKWKIKAKQGPNVKISFKGRQKKMSTWQSFWHLSTRGQKRTAGEGELKGNYLPTYGVGVKGECCSFTRLQQLCC